MEPDRHSLLRTLYLTIFLTATGLGTATFLLPVYAEGLGATYTDLGVISAVGNVVYTGFTLGCGYLLDRYEKIKLYTIYTGFGCITIFLFSFTRSIPHIIVMRGLMGIASATFWVTASTLTAEISPIEELTRSLGRYNLSWIIGFTVGPVIGGVISNLYGFTVFFYSLSAIILISLIVTLTHLKGKFESHNTQRREKIKIDELKGLASSYLTLVPFTLVLGIYMAIMPGHMKTVGITASVIGLLIAMTNGVRGLTFFNVEKLVKWGTWKSLFVASILLGSAMFLVTRAVDAISFAIPLVLYGVGAGIMTPVVLDFISKRTPTKVRGTAMGVHEGIYGVGMCLGPLIGGGIADVYSPSTMYLILVAVSLLILPLGYRMTHEANPLNRSK